MIRVYWRSTAEALSFVGRYVLLTARIWIRP